MAVSAQEQSLQRGKGVAAAVPTTPRLQASQGPSHRCISPPHQLVDSWASARAVGMKTGSRKEAS